MALDDYVLLGEVARGGMGVVYRARARGGREVAIKLMKGFAGSEPDPAPDAPSTVADSPGDEPTLRPSQVPDALARFDRERRLLSALGEADGFVPLLDAGESANGPFIVMPFLRGGTLRDRLVQGAFPPKQAWELGVRLANAIARAHERGIVHRDLKPENVLFTEDGRPLISDLGLAKHFRTDVAGASRSVQITMPGVSCGTAGYMPPEQIADATEVKPAADVFSVGAIIYECLAGKPAFGAENLVEFLKNLDSQRPEPLAVASPDTPAWLAKVVERALARDPRERYADGSELARALAGEEVPLAPKERDEAPEPGDGCLSRGVAASAALVALLALAAACA